MKKNNSLNRPLAAHSSSLRLYEDNYEEITKMIQNTDRTHAEEVRDLVDEGLRARRMGFGGGIGEIIGRYEQLLDRNTREKQSLTLNMREFYGLLLETLAASISARRMTWNYVARTVLKQSGYSDRQIGERYEAEMQACVDERNLIADELELLFDGNPAGDQQSGDARTASSAAPGIPNQEVKKS
jgi:hypothetical protein